MTDDAEALRLFRAATTAPHGGDHRESKRNNVTLAPVRGNTRAYLVTRLQVEAAIPNH